MVAHVKALLDHLHSTLRADRLRTYLTGAQLCNCSCNCTKVAARRYKNRKHLHSGD